MLSSLLHSGFIKKPMSFRQLGIWPTASLFLALLVANPSNAIDNERVVNGNFGSNAGWSSWTQRGTIVVDYNSSVVPMGGASPALRFYASGNFNGGIYQAVTLLGGSSYTLTGYFRDNGSSNAPGGGSLGTWGEVGIENSPPVNGQDALLDNTAEQMIKSETGICDNWNSPLSSGCSKAVTTYVCSGTGLQTRYLIVKAGEWQSAIDTSFDAISLFGPDPTGCTPPANPGSPIVGDATTNSLAVSNNPTDSPTAYFAIRINGGSYSNQYVQTDGSVSSSPVWRKKAEWGVKTVTGLASGVEYDFDLQAAYDSAGTCPSAFGASTLKQTLQCTPPVTPGKPGVFGESNSTLTVSLNVTDSDLNFYAIRINGDSLVNQFVQSNGGIGSSPAWQTKSNWGPRVVSGLSSGTAYTFDVMASASIAGDCPSAFGIGTSASTTLTTGAFTLPPGFSATQWLSPGSGINGGDGISFGPYTGPGGGTRMYITNAYWGAGEIRTVIINPDGSSGSSQQFATGFEDQIVGCTYNAVNGYWYAGAGSKVYWMKDKNGDGDALDANEKGALLSGLVGSPVLTNSKHAADKVAFNPLNANELFVGIGSYSDHGEEADPIYQGIIRRALLTSGETVDAASTGDISYYRYAYGFRNPSGIAFMSDGRLIATEHGPNCNYPEELNVILHGACYGFPVWYGDGTEVPSGNGCVPQGTCLNPPCPCVNFGSFTKPVGKLTPHASPIGIIQYNGTMFPLQYRGNLFVAEFGNLVNLSDATMGRRISRFIPDTDDGTAHWQLSNFFWEPNTNINTRQISWLADVQSGPDGSLYAIEFSNQGLSSNTGSIYRITFNDPTAPSAVVVTDDGTTTTSPSQLRATWTFSTDRESGIKGYWYSIGTSAGATNIRNWTFNGVATNVVATGLSLSEGQTYFVNVRSENGNVGAGSQGQFSSVSSSDGIQVIGGNNITIGIGNPSPSLTNSGPVIYTVTYSNATSVTLSPSDITAVKTGTANGVITVSGVGLATRTITISAITGDGTFGVSIVPGTASNESGSAPGINGTSFSVDNTAPVVSFGAPSTPLSTGGNVTYTISYAGADSINLLPASVILQKTGTANATVGISGSGNLQRTVTLSNVTGDGTIGITVSSGSATDAAGNLAPAAGPSATFTVDTSAPSISNITLIPSCVKTGDVLDVSATVTDSGSGVAIQNLLLLGPNLLINPSFELGGVASIAGWTNNSNPAYLSDNLYPAPPVGAQGTVHWVGVSCAYGSGTKVPEIRQTITVTPGQPVLLSAWVYTEASPNVCNSYLQWKDGTVSGDGQCQTVPGSNGSLLSNSHGWQLLRGTVIPSGNQLTVSLRMSWSCAGSGGGGNWDGISARQGLPATSYVDNQAVWTGVSSGLAPFTLMAVDGAGNATTGLSPLPLYDNSAPSTTASSPGSVYGGPILIDWTASDVGCNGSIENGSVRLYERKATGSWADSGLSGQSGEGGVFSYSPVDGAGTYHFSVVATDGLGNSLIPPSGVSGTGQATTLYLDSPVVNPIGAAWALPNNSNVTLENKVVTGALPGVFWIGETDRSAGLMVLSNDAVTQGQLVTVSGQLGISGTQRALSAIAVADKGSGSIPIPLGIIQRNLGGKDFNIYTPGVSGGGSLYNIGLLVRCWGTVTHVDTSNISDKIFVFDDGSGLTAGDGHAGVKVKCGTVDPPGLGSIVFTTGLVGSEQHNSLVKPIIFIRSIGDIIPL